MRLDESPLFEVDSIGYSCAEAYFQRKKYKKKFFDTEGYTKKYGKVNVAQIRNLIQLCRFPAIIFDLGGNGVGMGINMNKKLKAANPALLQQ